MQRKAFQVQVELDIQAITCPGVWLCPSGKISLQLYMLDSCIQTISAQPIFPVLCHEKFIFYKTFYSAHRLSELQKLLNRECLYMEMIQWQNCEVGNVLASFQTSLSELLYPSTHEGSVPGIDIDLLMDPERNFPGMIAPKVEVSTRTVIQDTVCDEKKCSSYVVNPKVIPSKGIGLRTNPVHQRKVCHSINYHRSRKCFPKMRSKAKIPFIYKKADEDLLARKPQGFAPERNTKCDCRKERRVRNIYYPSQLLTDKTSPKSENTSKFPSVRADCWAKSRNYMSRVANCLCNSSGHDEQCPVCSKYKYYFENVSPASSPRSRNKSFCPPSCSHRQQYKRSTSPEKRQKKCVYADLEKTGNAKVIRCSSGRESVNVDQGANKNCFCPPRKRPSLAEKLHQRLSETLDACMDCPFDVLDDSESPRSGGSQRLAPIYEENTVIECDCPEVDIGGFYKKFYNEARSKLRCDRYITPCCT